MSQVVSAPKSVSETPVNQKTCSLSDDPFVQTVIKRKINQLLSRPEFHPHEDEDLRQEFMSQLSVAMKTHRDDVGHRNPYIVMVIERKASNLLEHRRQAIRAEENVTSLNVMIDDGNGKRRERGQCISEDDQHRRLEVSKRPATEQFNLEQDMATVIASMPELWQELLRHRSQHSLAQTARIMGVPRSRLKSLIPKIAEVFEKAGLRDYLA